MKRFLLLFTLVTIIWACSKERFEEVQPEEPTAGNQVDTSNTVVITDSTQNDSTPTDTVIEKPIIIWKEVSIVKNNNTPEKTTKTITSNSDLPVYGDKGTAFYTYASKFVDANGNDVDYPITLEILELYTPKDMILADIPSTSNGVLLTSGGEFYVKAYKDGAEIFVKPFNYIAVQVPSYDPDWNMEVFVNKTNTNEFDDWVTGDEATWVDPSVSKEAFFLSVTDSINQSGSTGYDLSLSSLGWINCDYFYRFTGGKTPVTFTSDSIDIKYIQTYLYVPVANSIMRVSNATSGEIPVGQFLKAICYAVDSDEKTYLMVKGFTAQQDQNIEIDLTEVDKATFDQALEDL